jgi:DNA-binding transcriptional ArsR family regulator
MYLFVTVTRISPIGVSVVDTLEDQELNQSGPEPDDEDIEESENEEVSSPAETTPPPPAQKPPTRGPGRKPAAQPPAKPAPAAATRSKAPPAAAQKPPPTAATRSKVPPASVRAKQPSPNGSKDAIYRKSAGLLKLVSDPTRLAIVDVLRDGELHVGNLCERLGNMTQPAVSHHLALLRHGRVIEPRRQGKNNFYALTDECGQLLAGFVEEITSA